MGLLEFNKLPIGKRSRRLLREGKLIRHIEENTV